MQIRASSWQNERAFPAYVLMSVTDLLAERPAPESIWRSPHARKHSVLPVFSQVTGRLPLAAPTYGKLASSQDLGHDLPVMEEL